MASSGASSGKKGPLVRLRQTPDASYPKNGSYFPFRLVVGAFACLAITERDRDRALLEFYTAMKPCHAAALCARFHFP